MAVTVPVCRNSRLKKFCTAFQENQAKDFVAGTWSLIDTRAWSVHEVFFFRVRVTVHRNKFLSNKTNQMHQFPKFTPA
jgi:hypothetical protein